MSKFPEPSAASLFLLAGKVLRNRRTRIFNGVGKLPRRITEDRIAVLIEHRNLVPMSYQALAAFMVKGHGVVRSLLVVRYRVLWASLIEGFDDLCRLRSCSTRCCTATGPVGGTPTSCDFPRLAVGHVDANFPITLAEPVVWLLVSRQAAFVPELMEVLVGRKVMLAQMPKRRRRILITT